MADPVAITVTVPDLPVVTDVSVLGIQGSPGIFIGPAAPADTDILWADTSEAGDAVVPQGGTAGQVLAKVSSDDYDTGWVDVSSDGGLPTGGTTGQALVKASATDFDTTWAAPVPAVHANELHAKSFSVMLTPHPEVAKHLPDLQGAASFAGNILGGYIVAYPTAVPIGVTVDRISCWVETLAVDSVVRLGIYRPRADGTRTMDLVVDAGTVDASTTGQKDITLSPAVTLVSGTYYLAACTQGTNASTIRVRSRQFANAGAYLQPYTDAAFFGNNAGLWGLAYQHTTALTGFPDPITIADSVTNGPTGLVRPLVLLRVGSIL